MRVPNSGNQETVQTSQQSQNNFDRKFDKPKLLIFHNLNPPSNIFSLLY